MQVIWYDDCNEASTCTSNFNVCGEPDQLLRASARSGMLQVARLLNLLLRRNTPPDVECLTNDELDVAAALRKKTFLYRLFMNLATGRDEIPTHAEIKRNSYCRRRHFINFSMCELLDRAIALKFEGALSSYVQCLFKSPSETTRTRGVTRLGISSNSQGKNRTLDRKLQAAWTADGGTETVDTILTLSSGGVITGEADNIGNRKSAALGSGYEQQTVAQFRVVERDRLRFAGGSTKNLLMRSSMQEKDVHSLDIADCLPNDEDAQYLTARRDAFFEQVLDVRRQVLQLGEGATRNAPRRFTLLACSTVPYKAADGPVQRLRATTYGQKCGGSHLHRPIAATSSWTMV